MPTSQVSTFKWAQEMSSISLITKSLPFVIKENHCHLMDFSYNQIVDDNQILMISKLKKTNNRYKLWTLICLHQNLYTWILVFPATANW